METENKKFYTCKNDRTFKEVFLEEENSDLLKALLETILKIEIDKIEIKKTELLSGNINIKDKIVDKYITKVTIVNNDPEFMSYMSEEEDKRKIQNSLYNESREKGYNSGLKEGISKGKEEGIKEGSTAVARNMLNKNMKIEEISELTGLSIEIIKGINK